MESVISLQDVSAFSKIKYFGVKKEHPHEMNVERETFIRLRELIRSELEDTTVRSPRSVNLIFSTLQV